jgi:IS5 family transposase
MFLLYYENVKSERALRRQLPLRLDWLWFCEYDLEEELPHHSVLSKARRRWGPAVFAGFFQRILEQCLAAGLVDGETIHVDSSMIDANASKDALRPQLRVLGRQLYEQMEEQMEEPAAEAKELSEETEELSAGEEELETLPEASSDELARRAAPADPDARLGKKYGKSTLGYKDHRVVDDRCGIITATLTTPANVNDEKQLAAAIETHEVNTGAEVQTVVADKAYGIGENYQYLYQEEITPRISHKRYKKNQDDAFTNDQFTYDAVLDQYRCPAGQILKRKQVKAKEHAVCYQIDRAIFERCPFFDRCVTGPKSGRTVQRSDFAPYYEWADGCLSRGRRKWLMARRKAKAEGSFADAANNHGYKRARWRGQIRMEMQNLLIAAIQNLRKLLHHTRIPEVGAVLSLFLERFRAILDRWKSSGESRGDFWRRYDPISQNL